MKNYRYKTTAFFVIALLTISTALFAEEVTKEYHKEFAASSATTLDINSRYGNVVIESWNNNQIVIDVKITVNVSNKSKAEQDLSNIDALFSESGNVIKAWTEVNSKYFSKGVNTNDVSINYSIKMPVSSALNLGNRYGNTTINELSGLVNINISYGNLTIGKLARGNEKPWNNISLRYGSADIQEAGWLNLNTQYAKNVELSKCTAVLLESRYSDLNFGEISSIVGECAYGAIKIGNIRNLDLDNRYTGIKVGTLTNSLKFESNYGALTIDNITNGFESIEVDTRYSNVTLGIANNASYELNGEARYGGIKYDNNNFNFTKKIQERNTLTIAGVNGKDSSPKAKIKIEAAYATVNLVK